MLWLSSSFVWWLIWRSKASFFVTSTKSTLTTKITLLLGNNFVFHSKKFFVDVRERVWELQNRSKFTRILHFGLHGLLLLGNSRNVWHVNLDQEISNLDKVWAARIERNNWCWWRDWSKIFIGNDVVVKPSCIGTNSFDFYAFSCNCCTPKHGKELKIKTQNLWWQNIFVWGLLIFQRSRLVKQCLQVHFGLVLEFDFFGKNWLWD